MQNDMPIERDRVARIHYRLLDAAGETLESSRDGEPTALLFGHGNVIPGLESALEGHRAGERFEVVVEPDDAYGERIEGRTQRISKKHFPRPKALRPGLRVTLSTNDGPRPVTVLKVGAKMVDVDLNHPLAGQRLTFDIEVVDVREATPEEIAHGHAHGDGGHHHH